MIRLLLLLAALGGAALALGGVDASGRGALLGAVIAWIGLHWLSIVPWIAVVVLWRRLRSAERRVRTYEWIAAGAVEDAQAARARSGTRQRRRQLRRQA